MADFSKLLKYDIKNLKQDVDLEKLRQQVLQHQTLFLNAVLIFLTIIIAFNIFANRRNTARNLKGQVAALKEKNEAIAALTETQSELNKLLKDIPEELSANEIIDVLTDLAVLHNLKIVSFSPAKREEKKLYLKTTVKANVIANSYKDLWFFINAIEGADQMLRIESWNGKADVPRGRRARRAANEGDKPYLQAQIEVSSLELKQ